MELDRKNNAFSERTEEVVEEEHREKEFSLRYDEEKSELTLWCGGKVESVSIRPCFPWTAPEKHLSLIGRSGKTLQVLNHLQDLSSQEMEDLTKAMKQSGFLFEITQVFSIEEEFELRHWHIETQQGLRTVQTSMEKWPRPLPNGSYLLEDLGGDLYVIRKDTACEDKASEMFRAMLD